jgi:hypothetical protein
VSEPLNIFEAPLGAINLIEARVDTMQHFDDPPPLRVKTEFLKQPKLNGEDDDDDD